MPVEGDSMKFDAEEARPRHRHRRRGHRGRLRSPRSTWLATASRRRSLTKLDARVFSTAAADKGPAGLLGTFTPLAEALGVIPLLEAVATIQRRAAARTRSGSTRPTWSPLRIEPTETGGKLPLLGVDVSETGAQSVDGLALRFCPALPAVKAVVGEARQRSSASAARSAWWRHSVAERPKVIGGLVEVDAARRTAAG